MSARIRVCVLVFVAACGDEGAAAPADGPVMRDAMVRADVRVATDADAPPGDGPSVDGARAPDAEPPRDSGGGSGDAAVTRGCAPLAPPPGRVVRVTPADAARLGDVVRTAADGDVITFADGIYPVRGDVVMNASRRGITLISESRDASRVVLDGGEWEAREILQITASDVTVAHLTLRSAQDHLVHLYPGGGVGNVTGARLYALILEDGGQQFVKSNPDGGHATYATARFVDEVTVECSTFTMTARGRAYVPTNPHNASYPCYTGGIDAHAARGWVVRRNRFEGIYCDVPSLAEHAIHFWHSGRDATIEENVIVDCARGIGLGLYWGEDFNERPYADAPFASDRVAPYVGHFGGVVRNNFVRASVAAFDSGLSFEQALRVRVHHNTVVVEGAASGNALEYRWPNSLVELRNNLATRIVARDNGRAIEDRNVTGAAVAGMVDATGHLRPTATDAIDRGVPLDDAGLDLDGEPHTNGAPDIGADER